MLPSPTMMAPLVLLAAVIPAQAAPPPASVSVEILSTGPLFAGTSTSLRLTALDGSGTRLYAFNDAVNLDGVWSFSDGEPITRTGAFENGVLLLEGVVLPEGRVAVLDGDRALGESATLRVLPGFLTLLPPLVAIVLALVTRQVLLSLVTAVWLGAAIANGTLNPLTAFLRTADSYIVPALADTDHAYIILFSLSLAGMVGIITASGGIRGIVDVISRFARDNRSGQVSTWLMGVLIFFDDYANSLIVGNTMRPFTDRVRISREKLSFIVDATAAPVATIGVISTWTAYQVGLISEEIGDQEAYGFFLRSIPYAFYSLLMLCFVLLCGLTLRDFGPMRRAESRCRDTGKVLDDNARPLVDEQLDRMAQRASIPTRWYNAAIPIGCVIGFTIIGLFATDRDAFRSLLWAALGASAVAAVLVMAQGESLSAVTSSWVDGARSLVLAVMILILAWSIGAVCKDLHTGDYVVTMTRGLLSPRLIPALTFVSAGVIAFSTGTSYGTMAILIPILLPLVFSLSGEAGFEDATTRTLALATLAATLGGAVFGDHCSPISDTTVLSSMAAGADHIDHVRTQLPYAATVASIALPCYVAVGLGVPVAVVLVAGLALVCGVLFWLGRGDEVRIAAPDGAEASGAETPTGADI